MSSPKKPTFTSYEWFIIAVLTFLQFTVILDFMVLSPLSAILIPEMHITPSQFSLVVSAYAFSAGASGLLAAGFADKFDRKRLLIFFYVGFVLGTALCAMATTYEFLLFARVFTGVFGGVIGSIAFAIITDLFPMEKRGRVMGYVQMAFAVSQIAGLPIGLYLANHVNWHAPFWMIVGLAIPAGLVIATRMKPVDGHLKLRSDRNPFEHLIATATKFDHIKGFAASALLAIGGYMLMPLGAAYATNNLGLTKDDLVPLYAVTGLFMIFVGPLSGKIADRVGKYPVFVVGCTIAMSMVAWYTNMGITPLWMLMIMQIVLFAGLTARMIAASALLTALPEPKDRGAFMGINSSIQQMSGGLAALFAGLIVVQEGQGSQAVEVAGQVATEATGRLLHYDILGIVVVSSVMVNMVLFAVVNKTVKRKQARAAESNAKTVEPQVAMVAE
ncbi:MAG: MFS transporter [Bacteroidia bacterium]